MIICSRPECQTTAGCRCPKLPPNWGKINGEDHPDTIVAKAAMKAERERCAKIVEQMAGFKTHKFRKQVADAIRNPATFYERG